jgi:hypothetical protein
MYCGAAALSMALRSYGVATSQRDLWPRISQPNQYGQVVGHTWLMAREAIRRGFAAAIVQAIDPIPLVRAALAADARVIMNHRPLNGRTNGHYTVAVAATKGTISFHDPDVGPNQTRSDADLRALWTRGGEIAGNVLIAIGKGSSAPHPCPVCHRESVVEPCRRCGTQVVLQPAAVFGCLDLACAGRVLQGYFCPNCDERACLDPLCECRRKTNA